MQPCDYIVEPGIDIMTWHDQNSKHKQQLTTLTQTFVSFSYLQSQFLGVYLEKVGMVTIAK